MIKHSGAPHEGSARPGSKPVAGVGPGTRVSEYVLDELLGTGGFGQVWRAHHAVLAEKVVAVKIPHDPSVLEFFEREGVVQHRLDHDGIVKVLGLDLEAPIPYLLQEYVEGENLARLIDRRGKLPLAETMRIFSALVEILAFAHKRGVVHRDLKPANVLVLPDGSVRVTDFGLARSVGAGDESALAVSVLDPPTAERAGFGTWEYLPSEARRSRGGASPDPRTDVYSLGVMLYEMLTGQLPSGRVSLKSVEIGVDRIFARCYTASGERFSDAVELEKALRAWREAPAGGMGGNAGDSAIRDGREHSHNTGGSHGSSRGERRAQRLGTALLVLPPALILVFIVMLINYKPNGLAPPPDQAAVASALDGPWDADEAAELNLLRRNIERHPAEVSEAVSALNDFIARSRDENLTAKALYWKRAIEGTTEPQNFHVVWKGFQLNPEAYKRQVFRWMEFGRPDIYLKVFRARDGRERVVYDGAKEAISAWKRRSRAANAPSFDLTWSRGDAIRLELWERDPVLDNRLAKLEAPAGLSILLLSSATRTEQGHYIDLQSDFAFGK